MTSCTIIISHYESKKFLWACLRKIIQNQHPDVFIKIIIADQSSWVTNQEIRAYCKLAYPFIDEKAITVLHLEPLYSGFGLDWIFRNMDIQTDYVMQIHVDVVPLTPAYLSVPIRLIEEYGFSFVGQLQCINDNNASIYPPSPFFAMAQCYNVAPASVYKELSLKAGFTRYHNRLRAAELGMTWENNGWHNWAKPHYHERGSDDDIVAFSYEDRHLQHDKLGLAISGYIEPGYGRIIDSLVFHFGSANEARGVMRSMPELYQHYTKRINENYSDELIAEMVELARKNTPPSMQILTRNFWDGKLKVSSPPSEELNKRIEELKSL